MIIKLAEAVISKRGDRTWLRIRRVNGSSGYDTAEASASLCRAASGYPHAWSAGEMRAKL